MTREDTSTAPDLVRCGLLAHEESETTPVGSLLREVRKCGAVNCSAATGLQECPPGDDIVLLTVESPAELDLVSAIARRRSLVVISLDHHAVRPIDVMSRGACGYVTGEAAPEELDCAFRSVRRGNAFVCCPSEREDWTETSENGHRSRASVADELTKQLTVRERQVLKHLAAGKTNQEIADYLGLSLKTVEAYRTRLSTKTGVKRKADLVRFAYAAGLWECTPEEYLAAPSKATAAGSST